MRIGIFGGSFNPPHKMHIDIGFKLVSKHYVDKVIYVPTGCKYKYKNNLIGDEFRLEMLKIITDKYECFDVCDYELKDYVVYTCETLNYFKENYVKDDIYFICGTDNLSYMDKWMNGEEILSNFKILVIRRDDENIEKLLKKYEKFINNIIVVDIDQSDISSTYIREKLKNGDDVLDLLDKDVLKYIKSNNLYR